MICSLTYGLKDGKMLFVDEVENGLSCGCVCPKCKTPLIAKNRGEQKDSHFAHYNGDECYGAVEAAIHLLAKQVLQNEKSISTPDFICYCEELNIKTTIYKSRKVVFDNIVLEKRMKDNGNVIIPDAIGYIEGEPPLLIEFANTHFIDQAKRQKIIDSNWICLEIDLKDIALNEESIRRLLFTSGSKAWINYPELENQAIVWTSEQIKKWYEDDEKRSLELLEKDEKRRLEQLVLMEKRDEEAKSIMDGYFSNPNINVFNYDELNQKCPMLKLELTKLVSTSFYSHPLLRNIISGEYWDGKVYEIPNSNKAFGSYIYLENEKIHIYPGVRIPNLSIDESYELLMEGLNEIKRIRNINDCRLCKHSIDIIDSTYICGFSENYQQNKD